MKNEIDNRVDLFYVADRLVNILDANDKDLRREVEEFREEIFHNIGANAVHDHNNQEKEMSEIICQECGCDEGTLLKEFDNDKNYYWSELIDMTNVCVSCGSENLKEKE